MHGTEHHLEEAEHAKHAQHDPFTSRVAMTMAIVAAILACITLLSHRAHTGTLQNRILAGENKTAASDMWNYYQAKKNRQYSRQDQSVQMTVAAAGYSGEQKKLAERELSKWKASTEKWEKDTQKIQKDAEALDAEYKNYQDKSETLHHQADFFDLGELGVELALVLCSIAVLTRSKGFWYSGMLVCAIGLGVALYGFTIKSHASHGGDHPTSGETEHKSGKEHKKDKKPKSSEHSPANSH